MRVTISFSVAGEFEPDKEWIEELFAAYDIQILVNDDPTIYEVIDRGADGLDSETPVEGSLQYCLEWIELNREPEERFRYQVRGCTQFDPNPHWRG